MSYPGALVLIVAGLMYLAVAGMITPVNAIVAVILAVGIVTLVSAVDREDLRK